MSQSTGENTEAAALLENQNIQGSNSDSQLVPVHVVQSIRDEMRSLKEKNDALENHINMLRWQQPQAQAQPAQNPFGNVDPEDSVKVKDLANVFGAYQNQMETKLGELKFAAKATDYEDVISKYLSAAIKEDPELVEDLKKSKTPYKDAYKACKASSAFHNDLAKSKENAKPKEEVQRMVNNTKQSGNLASVGNSSSVSTTPKYSQMTDAEFRSLKAQNMLKGGRKAL